MRRDAAVSKAAQRGMASLEFVLVLPVFLLLFFGIIEFGILLWQRHVVFEAAAEGARLATFHADAGEVEAEVREWLLGGGVTREPTILVGTCAPSPTPQPVDVSVGVDFSFIVLPGFVEELAGVRRIETTASAVCEWDGV